MPNAIKLMFVIPVLFCLLGDSAEAQRIRLETRMGANDAIQAKAKYEQRNGRRKFNVELEDALPNRTYGVMIRRRGRVIDSAVFKTNQLGVGEIDVDTTEGDIVPQLQAGDVVQIWFNRRRILAGTLR